MRNANLLYFGLDKISSDSCNSTSQIVLWLKKTYHENKQFKIEVDHFLSRFNNGVDDKITVEDFVNLEFDKVISKEKIKIIKRFFDEVLNTFKI